MTGTILTLGEAKARSLERWQKIKADIPNIKTRGSDNGQPHEDVYGRCGFCLRGNSVNLPRHNFTSWICTASECHDCPLYPDTCTDSRSTALYWKIVKAIKDKLPAEQLTALVDKMIARIESVEVEQEGK